MKLFLKILIALVVVVNLAILFTGHQYLYKAVYYNFVNIDDYKIFENRHITASDTPQPWAVSQNYNQASLSGELVKSLEETQTTAFLIIKNDSIESEYYWDGYGPESYSNSFSAAKSYVSALIGVAITEGYITGINDSVSKYLPKFKPGSKKPITIKHLLQMSSGLSWDEAYASPFSITTKAYYGKDLDKLIYSLESIEEPGITWNYRSGDTQILAMVLREATQMPLAKYAEKKLWQPLGYVKDALWSLNKKDGMEKAYCCINSNARDFARIAKLYNNNGLWNDKQIIDSSYIYNSLQPCNLSYKNEKVDFYGYQWWLDPNYKSHKIFYARGILGQFIISIPEKNIIIVRLGHERGDRKQGSMHHSLIYQMIDEALR